MPSQRAPRLWEWRPSQRQWVAFAATVAAAALLAWLAYQQGRVSGGFDSTAVASERREARSRLELLERENSRLNAQVAELEMARQLDREAYGQIERTLAELQAQLSDPGRRPRLLSEHRFAGRRHPGIADSPLRAPPRRRTARVQARVDVDPVDAA